MKYKDEKAFQKRIADILRSADLCFSAEFKVSDGKPDDYLSYDPKRYLRADFYIGGAEQAIIECKVKPSAASFARGLGQCLLYRHNIRVKHFVLCMPESYRIDWGYHYWDYEELCKNNGIGFATEENVIEVLKRVAGSLDDFCKLSQVDAWQKQIDAKWAATLANLYRKA